MTTHVKEILRWLAIALSGGFALFLSSYFSYEIITNRPIDWIMVAIAIPFLILITSPFYTVAYICLRRQYRQLFKVAGVIGAIVVFSTLNSFLRHLHLPEFLPIDDSAPPLESVGRLIAGLLTALGPILAAAWLYRFCDRLAKPPTRTPVQLSKANG